MIQPKRARSRSHFRCYRCHHRIGVVRPIGDERHLRPMAEVRVSFRESGAVDLTCPECEAVSRFTWSKVRVIDSAESITAPGD